MERVFGYSEHEVVSRNVRLLTSADHRSRHDSYVERYLTTSERPIIGTGRVLVGQRTDGTGFPMELSVGEAERAAGRIFTGFIRDLTTQQRLELRLVHPDHVTAAELAGDGEVKERSVAQSPLLVEPEACCPDLLLFQRCFAPISRSSFQGPSSRKAGFIEDDPSIISIGPDRSIEYTHAQ